MSKSKETLSGVITYEILPDGCLNGIYSNDHPKTQNKIFNEIARKSDENPEEILGEYICCYIDFGNTIQKCKLIIHNKSKRKQNGQYHFEWFDGKEMIFEGTGWLTRKNQLTVSYRRK